MKRLIPPWRAGHGSGIFLVIYAGVTPDGRRLKWADRCEKSADQRNCCG